jgi:hypothetical protein
VGSGCFVEEGAPALTVGSGCFVEEGAPAGTMERVGAAEEEGGGVGGCTRRRYLALAGISGVVRVFMAS